MLSFLVSHLKCFVQFIPCTIFNRSVNYWVDLLHLLDVLFLIALRIISTSFANNVVYISFAVHQKIYSLIYYLKSSMLYIFNSFASVIIVFIYHFSHETSMWNAFKITHVISRK